MSKIQKAKQQARAASYAEALEKIQKTMTRKEQKIASNGQMQIEKNLEKILTSHSSELESRIEQITKSANGRLRVDFKGNGTN